MYTILRSDTAFRKVDHLNFHVIYFSSMPTKRTLARLDFFLLACWVYVRWHEWQKGFDFTFLTDSISIKDEHVKPMLYKMANFYILAFLPQPLKEEKWDVAFHHFHISFRIIRHVLKNIDIIFRCFAGLSLFYASKMFLPSICTFL